MIKRVLLFVLAAVLLLVVAVAANTWRQGSRQLQVPAAPPFALDNEAVADKLAGALRFQTVSSLTDAQLNAAEFQKLHAYLQQRFPKLHATLQREMVGGLSLLYTWKGSDPGARPIALLSHQDVVPIEPGTEGQWQIPPFAGVVRDGHVWGRAPGTTRGT